MAPHRPAELADATTNELLAILEVMFLVATVDRHFSPEERREFLEHAESLSEGQLQAEQLSQLVSSWAARQPENIDVRIHQLATDLTDETSRRIAYGLALEVADADGQRQMSEKAFLLKLARAFGLDGEESEDISRSVRMSQPPPKDIP